MVVEPTTLAKSMGEPKSDPALGPIGGMRRTLIIVLVAAAVLAYALPGGTYDLVVRQTYGLVIWCMLGIGFAFGLLPRCRPTRIALIACGLLLLYAAWVALSLTWTESAERTTEEIARVLDYLGLLVLVGSLLDRRTWRAAAEGLVCGAALVCVLSVASRLVPGAFPRAIVNVVFDTDRLAYPFGYWNAVGAWGAMTATMGLAYSASDARLRRATGLGAVPVAMTMVYLSYSRGGVLAVAVGLAAVLVLSRHRWTIALHGACAAFGTAIIIAAIRSHSDIARATGSSGGLAVAVVIAFACLLGCVIALLSRGSGVDGWRLSRRSARTTMGSCAVLAVSAVALFGSPIISRAWREFRNPVLAQTTDPTQRLTTLSGTRYNLWRVAVEAAEQYPLTGTGAGTYEFWWNQHALDTEFVLNAHSIWFENLAELGWPGLVAIIGAIAGLLSVGVAARRRMRRSATAAAGTALLAALIVFVVEASIDWMWQVTAVTAIALAAVATLSARLSGARPRLPWFWRGTLVAAAAIAAVIQLPGLLSTVEIGRSQAAVRAGQGATALAWARAAEHAEPWAASPYVQDGLVLEALGNREAAARALSIATRNEPTNFANWVLLARVEFERGRIASAVRDELRAYRLRPDSNLFEHDG